MYFCKIMCHYLISLHICINLSFEREKESMSYSYTYLIQQVTNSKKRIDSIEVFTFITNVKYVYVCI